MTEPLLKKLPVTWGDSAEYSAEAATHPKSLSTDQLWLEKWPSKDSN